MRNLAYVIIGVVLAGTLVLANPPAQQSRSAEVLLGQALHQEEVEGNLDAAIGTYKKILAEYPDNRPLAAKALLQMGRCYEKLGKDGARKAYERLLRDYSDQSEEAKLARARLAVLRKPALNESGMATRQVWTSPDLGFEGAPSPDGRYLSFVDWTTGDLAIRDLETGKNRRLTNKGPWVKSDEFALFSRWSPDGKQIAYDWYDGKSFVGLRVIAKEGGKPRVVFESNGDQGWMQTCDWSPDGKDILTLLEKKDGTRQIMLVAAADGATKVIKTLDGHDSRLQTMRFSRDGKYIVYDWPQQEGSGNRDIFLIPADGGQEVPLVRHPADDHLLGFPPDGKGILFASDRTGSQDICFLPVSGGKAQGVPELVKAGVEEIIPMGFTQGGSFYYYYAQERWAVDVYVARMDPKSGRILEPPEIAIKRFEGRNSCPAYSPDGKYLAYVTTRSRTFQSALRPNILCIRSLETGKEREFKTKFQLLAMPRWSPDGRSLYLGARDDGGRNGIYRVDVQNVDSTPIVRAEQPMSLRYHAISPDGNTLVYERRRANEPYQIISRNLTTGEEKLLYAGEDPARFSVSPDGRWLAMITDKMKVLQVMPASGGEPKHLLRFEARQVFGPLLALGWTTDGKYILFTRQQPEKDKDQFALWRIPAEGGEPQQLNLVMAGFRSLSAHPDGQHLAFGSPGFTLKSPAIWVMENFLPKTVAAK